MSKDIRWISFEEAQQRYGNGGGSFLSANVARVDPSGSDATGTVGDLNKPFLTVQGAINAIQALDAAPKFPVIDIGNNNYGDEDVTTSLNTLMFLGRTPCAIFYIPFGTIPSPDAANAPFNSLTCTAETGDTTIILKDCYEPSLITGSPAGILSVQLSNATLDTISTGSSPINVDGGGDSNLDFIEATQQGAIVAIANMASNPVTIDADEGTVTATNCVLKNITCSDLEIYNCVITGSLTTDQTNIHSDLSPTSIFPDSDPHIAGAGYWLAGVLTKSTG